MIQEMLASTKVGLTTANFLTYIVPPFLCQYWMAVLVQCEGTKMYRLALLPIALWLAWRATWVDMSGGSVAQVQLNGVLITQMCSISTRTASWAFAHVRYRRDEQPDTLYSACWNALDLLSNPRGLGWNWPRGLVVPRPMVETDSRMTFVMLSATNFAVNAFAFDACVQWIRAMGPETFGSLEGGTLFDGSLPPMFALARAVVISSVAAWSVYFGIQYTHQLLALVCVGLLGQHPRQWPPLFDAPWWSGSLGELWGWRWHQMMRDIVLTLGGRPFERVFGGRLWSVVGAFLVSAAFHDIELRSNGRGGNTLVVVGFWVMNGVGIVLERVWMRVTGKKVGGMWGRAWMVLWMLIWGVPMVELYARVGRFGSLCLPGRFEPSRALVEKLLYQ